MLNTQEHINLMTMFEKEFKGRRLDREAKTLWPRGRIYQDGNVNEHFDAYRRGYALGKVIGREGN